MKKNSACLCVALLDMMKDDIMVDAAAAAAAGAAGALR